MALSTEKQLWCFRSTADPVSNTINFRCLKAKCHIAKPYHGSNRAAELCTSSEIWLGADSNGSSYDYHRACSVIFNVNC